LHDELARKYFNQFFENKFWIGQLRTMLAIPGQEQTGPLAAARALLQLVRQNTQLHLRG
jgi:hypothetical protein